MGEVLQFPQVRFVPVRVAKGLDVMVPLDTINAYTSGTIPLSAIDEIFIKSVLMQWAKWHDDV
jgi:hypothetical protein